MAGGAEGDATFESTPSWIIGAVVFGIVAVSLVIEKLLHRLGHYLLHKDKIPLHMALQKIKEELMLLGFISLLLTFFQDETTKWCISEKLAQKWLPCHYKPAETTAHFVSAGGRHLLAGAAGGSTCPTGKIHFVSLTVLHDLHYLIFILAIVHVLSCQLIVLLGEMKIRQWKKWEESIRMQNANDEGRVIDIRNHDFIKEHFGGINANKRNYVKSFFKHLAGILTKNDYAAMRMGFVLTHCNGNQRFNFHKYIVYAYEADFNKIVSISWFMWLFVAISLTLNVAGWHIYFGIAFIPFTLLLILGTKLQQVITALATRIAQKNSIIFGEVRIEPSDDYFWFGSTKVALSLIHIILFVNSFGFSIFFWTLFKFGLNSCVMGDAIYAYPRIIIMVVAQTICSYSTLPLYAIVTQMGSSYNKEAMERYGTRVTDSGSLANSNFQGASAASSVEMSNHQRH